VKRQKPIKSAEDEQRIPYGVRLPGFMVDDEIGLGDLIKRATSAMGIKTCGGCEKRAYALNQYVVFRR
jgi:hypothetical protein